MRAVFTVMDELHCAATVDEALDLLEAGATVIAGGTDFVAMYEAGAITSRVVVDINRVPELSRLTVEASGVSAGAACTLATFSATSGDAYWGALRDGAVLIGSTQTRQRGTIGGNVCRASPSGDSLPGLLVSEAEVVIRSAQGQRTVPAERFFTGPGRTVMAPGELLERIELSASDRVSAYVRHTTRAAMDLATVGVATSLRVDEGRVTGLRIGVAGAAPTPLLLACGEGYEHDASDVAGMAARWAEALQDLVSPIDDARATAWYRRRLLSPLLHRSLVRAISRAPSSLEL